jgi:hypothetical protein
VDRQKRAGTKKAASKWLTKRPRQLVVSRSTMWNRVQKLIPDPALHECFAAEPLPVE